ncbi:MAG: imidazolonepropionase [Cyanobacteria bacterium REEB65]|nr:imidazolonepropionase [Cyanobacteria bacterium REEB65]
MVASIDLLIEHAAQVVSPIGRGALKSTDQGALEICADGAVAVAGGKVVALGPTDLVRSSVGVGPQTAIWDAHGLVVTPGLVDAHTHVVYAGDRLDDFEARARGATYAEILAAGGGIHQTVALTRAASDADLRSQASRRLDRMLHAGTTVVESKSGYGLDIQTELKQLATMRELNEGGGAPELVPTFLGAHAVPFGQSADEAIDYLLAEVLPAVAAQGVARFCDVFCERGVFNPEQSERLLRAAVGVGLRPKLHVDELVDTGGAALAARVGAVSADHLHCSSEEGLRQMAASGTVAVLLPGTAVFLGMADQAPARRMVELGVPIALGTDCNPGSCTSESMALMMSLAVSQLKLSPAEALVAATCNAAAACGLEARVGRLAPGMQADLVLWDVPDYRAISYAMGVNLARTVVQRGRVVAGMPGRAATSFRMA